MRETVTETLAAQVLALVDHGLVAGMGHPEPGEMCVEAAVAFALGLPHDDRPSCVGKAVRQFAIGLNDARWSSNQARATGMRRLAVAQLGSDAIDQRRFATLVAEGAIRRVVPMALRAAAGLIPEHADTLIVAANRCEREGTAESARNARAVVRAAAAAYAAAADAAAYAAAYAADATDAAYAAADAAADAAAAAATAAAAAYADAAYAAATTDAADAAAYAAAYAAATTDAADAARDLILTTAAQVGEEALRACASPGVQWLPLCEDA